jgi:glycosyltransferase involved in cell wall biosynthesis
VTTALAGRVVPALRNAAPRRRRTRVMQVTDWLEPGGKERVALNIANLLPRDRFESFLCTTRTSSGSLERVVSADVRRLRLERTHTVDVAAMRRLIAFNSAHRVEVMHAHGTSLFVAGIASMFPPYPKLIWHDHYGPYRRDDRPAWLYRLAASRIDAVIAVNEALLEWARRQLKVRADRTWYLPNFVCDDTAQVSARRKQRVGELPGVRGRRVVCVAHLRPQKDHTTLLHAFAAVVPCVPDAHLLLIGGHSDARYRDHLVALISRLALERHVTVMGQQDDVAAVLAQCDIGVLSSESEGFPLALIEYGHAHLATVATDVGQCAEILDHGRAGRLVPPAQPAALADALADVLMHADERAATANRLAARARECYGAGPLMEQICRIYDSVLPPPSEHAELFTGVEVV